MLFNGLTATSWRLGLHRIRRQKLFAFIKIGGLGVGLAAALYAAAYTRFETSYGRFHPNADRVFRVTGPEFPGTPYALCERLKSTIPGVAAATAVKRISTADSRSYLRAGDRRLGEDRFYAADPDFFRVFGARFLAGRPETSLVDIRSVVVTESAARRYFGTPDCLGRVLRIDDKIDVRVDAVIADWPVSSHFSFNLLAPAGAMPELFGMDDRDGWSSWNYQTYILLAAGANSASVLAAIPGAFPESYRKTREDRLRSLGLQALPDIHLGSLPRGEFEPGGDRKRILVLAAISLLILLSAIFNFVNLSTAQSLQRLREMGVRKVLGAGRGSIVRQILVESYLQTGLAAAVGMVLFGVAFPAFNRFSGSVLNWSELSWPKTALFLAALTVLVGTAAGLYPAFAAAALSAVRALRGEKGLDRGKSMSRNVLLALQFFLSCGLLTAAFTIQGQMNFIRGRDLGLDTESLVNIPLPPAQAGRADALKADLLRIPGILSVSASDFRPGRDGSNQTFVWEGKDPEQEEYLRWFAVDADFVDTFGLRISAGRNFGSADQTTGELHFLVNESAARLIGRPDPVGRSLSFEGSILGDRGRIVGVVEDFNFRSLHHPLEPLALLALPAEVVRRASGEDRSIPLFKMLSVKIAGRETSRTLAAIQAFCLENFPEDPGSWFFFDEEFGRTYAAEIKTGRMLAALSFLAAALAGLGVFGLSAYFVERRRKEISLRRILGASTGGIVASFSRGFIVLLAISAAASALPSFLFLRAWMDRFAYRVILGPWFFAAGFLSMAALLFLSVGVNIFRAAEANPADHLKSE
ncbi:MAG: ABC transporter permease [Candidatus Aminicenantes bacterium]|nr:ABC transporter permease [Candidatus Aminicenantes bacterium]